jgi:glycosyltransferase involved in cell wall biosynthesis
MSRVDVVVPCYNYGRFLPQCVESVLSQEGVDVRVLIIDDCSQDDSETVGRRLSQSDQRVEFHRHVVNKGHIATYNEGLLGWAGGDYVVLLSADDMLAPGALSRVARSLDQAPEVGLCYGGQLEFHDQPPELRPDREDGYSCEVMQGRTFLAMVCGLGGNPVPTPTAVVRTGLQKSIGGYKPALPHSGDLEMWLRCAANASVARLSSVQAFKREHAENMVKQYAPRILPDLEQRELAFESALVGSAAQIGNAEALLRNARKSLAAQAFWGAHALFEKGQPDSSERLLAFALKLDPSWSNRPEWRRMLWKRRIGPRLWAGLEPIVALLRARSKLGGGGGS